MVKCKRLTEAPTLLLCFSCSSARVQEKLFESSYSKLIGIREDNWCRPMVSTSTFSLTEVFWVWFFPVALSSELNPRVLDNTKDNFFHEDRDIQYLYDAVISLILMSFVGACIISVFPFGLNVV